ncbi:hypothetical protein CHLRE_14g629700v5 [Chlamydomonas reinhardtii]|uniref:Malic enzyme n=1 Tax=Chlamydomonas reinhardtii TaxID=3055 RepID=A0A2K3CYK2_CHLRE|nr:uncharacterized protein CHLRE_14g629700v5 [Chlamydomonas reinhardtii]PNW73367.1 hypothetical protein CHLRE_14g629700v5 [Chlamydomonas reinhardtii]
MKLQSTSFRASVRSGRQGHLLAPANCHNAHTARSLHLNATAFKDTPAQADMNAATSEASIKLPMNLSTEAAPPGVRADVQGAGPFATAGPQPIDKYMWLRDLRMASPSSYFRVLVNNTLDVLPYIYTPTVGKACQEYHTLGIATRGLYLRIDQDKGKILERLKAWPQKRVRTIVVTDGERILGLGDLGANGMGISEGKIELYTAAAGVNPAVCLPVCLDVGTNNVKLREHPKYKGVRAARPPQKEYDEFVQEFMEAIRAWQPHTLIQFEDFGNTNAFRILDKYRDDYCCFNDDIQGTAAITLAALLAALRVTGQRLADQRILFLGAGEAAAGIATLISYCMTRRDNIEPAAARQRCHLMDSKGLVIASRTDLQHHKRPFAHSDVPPCTTLIEAVRAIKPTVLIGASAVPNSFTQEVVEAMAELNARPIICPLSNPTSQAECTFEQAWKWTNGRVLFASGSPFDPITDAQGIAHHPPQANNAYIFPAVGHAAVLTKSKRVPEELFLVAAEQLAAMATVEELSRGHLFPVFSHIRDISASIMASCAHYLVTEGLGRNPRGWSQEDLEQGNGWRRAARAAMWSPPAAGSATASASMEDVTPLSSMDLLPAPGAEKPPAPLMSGELW